MTTQIHENLSYAEYAALPGLRYSSLKPMVLSPAHFKYAQECGWKQTSAQAIGSAVHTLLLRPTDFPLLFACWSKNLGRMDARTENYKAFVADHGEEKTILKEEDWNTALMIADAVVNSATWKRHCEKARKELAIVWTCRDTGLTCKASLDCYDGEMITDLKTAADASTFKFVSAIFRYRYVGQMAWYHEAAQEAGLRPGRRVTLLAVQSKPPYLPNTFLLKEEVLHKYSLENQDLRRRYKFCVENNTWPGFSEEPYEVGLPKWDTEYQPEEEDY